VQLKKKIKNIKIRWNDRKELLFQNDKKRAVNNFHNVARNPTYHDCGFARYTEKVLNDTDVKRLRSTILEKVNDGLKPSEQELKYLELTSETLNRFLDREEFKNALMMLDPDFIDYVPTLHAARSDRLARDPRQLLRPQKETQNRQNRIPKRKHQTQKVADRLSLHFGQKRRDQSEARARQAEPARVHPAAQASAGRPQQLHRAEETPERRRPLQALHQPQLQRHPEVQESRLHRHDGQAVPARAPPALQAHPRPPQKHQPQRLHQELHPPASTRRAVLQTLHQRPRKNRRPQSLHRLVLERPAVSPQTLDGSLGPSSRTEKN